MPTAISYCRTSTQGQKDAETIASQRKVVERLRVKHGATMLPYGPRGDGRLEDDGVSGRLLEGREFSQAIDDLEAGKVKPDFIIVPSTSRLSREDTFSEDQRVQIQSAIDTARINAVLRVSRVQVIDTEGVHQDLRQAALEDSHERDKIRSRTMNGKHAHFDDNKYVRGGKAPYGYRVKDETLAICPETSPHLLKMLDWYIEGGPTHAARKLTLAEVLTPMFGTTERKNRAKDWTPTRWSPVTVQHIVRRIDAYLGTQTLLYDGKPYTMKYEPLIDLTLHAKIVRAMKTKTIKRRDVFLSTGLTLCVCGSPVHVRNTHDRHYMRCRRGKCSGSMREEKFSAVLWQSALCRLVGIQASERASVAPVDYRPALGVARAKVRAVQDDIKTILDAMLTGGLNKTVWKSKNDALNVELAQAEAEVTRIEAEKKDQEVKAKTEESVEAKVTSLLEELLTNEPTLDRKRQVARELLGAEKIVVDWKKHTLTWPAFGKLPPMTVSLDETNFEPTEGILVTTKFVGSKNPVAAYKKAIEAAGGTASEVSPGRFKVRLPA